jgi:hypothetical protein
MPRELLVIERRDRPPTNFGIASVFGVVTLLGVDALVLSRVPWSGALAWPSQLWHFFFAASLLVVLLFSAREAMLVAAVGAVGGCCFYAELWHLLARAGMLAEIAWYMLYIGLHTGCVLAGVYLCLERQLVAGRAALALAALSITLNLGYFAMHHDDGRYYSLLPPVMLPGN